MDDAQTMAGPLRGDLAASQRAEEDLRNGELYYRTFTNATSDLVFLKDAAFRYLISNTANNAFLGRSEAEIIGRTDAELMPPGPARNCRASDEAALADEHGITTEEVVGIKTYQVVKFPVALHGGAVGVGGYIRDITGRKRAEAYRTMGLGILASLNEPGTLESTLQNVIAALKTQTGFDAVGIRLQDGEDFPYFAQQGFSEVFLQTENALAERTPDGGVCRDSDGKVRLECTCGLVLSGTADLALPCFSRGGSFWTNDATPLLDLPADQDPRHRPRNQCIHLGYTSVALIPIRTTERIVGLLHLNDRRRDGFTVEAIESLEDIAAHIGSALMRKRATEALRASEREFRVLAECMPQIVWVTRPDGWNTYFNQRWVDYTGLTLEESYGHGWNKPFHPDDQQRAWEAWREAVENDAPYSLECRLRRADGTYRWWLIRGVALRNEQGCVLKWFGTCTDIEDLKQAETELRKMETLQSVGTLAGGIAHDFNNILTGLFGNMGLARDALPPGHPACAYLVEAGKSMNRAIRLTQQLLTFAKGGDPIKEDLCLGSLIEEVAHFDLSGSNVRLQFRQVGEPWRAKADKGQLQQVISNLVINARQSMHKGGHLWVTLENAEPRAAAEVGLVPGPYVRVTVRDEGDGIDPAVLERIFEPYFTTKVTGSGLGLATVRSIVTKHGGHIRVTSTPGVGTTFTFLLPASDAAPSAEAPGPALDSAPPKRSGRILVMDDEAMIRTLAASMLERGGYTVATAADGQETVAMYRQAMADGMPFDAVIMDLTIPGGFGGREAIGDLLMLDPQVRAIVSSGYSDDPAMARPAEYGFCGTAAKPYTRAKLCEVVARVLAMASPALGPGRECR